MDAVVLALSWACWTSISVAGTTPLFVDRASEVGLDFVHDAGRTGSFHFPEIQGSGAAFVDYDADGDLDVFVLQGGLVTSPGQDADGDRVTGRLYRNDLVVEPDGTRVLRFTDVTEASGIRTHGYGQGVAVGDIDNDGWPDLYVTNFGSTEMWHNDGDGTFTEMTEETNTRSPAWNTSASFFDYDRDGWLDLYVTTYVDFTVDTNQTCFPLGGSRDYCSPTVYEGQSDRLFRNRGDGRFEDVSGPAGIRAQPGPGLGVVTVDADGDGWLDVFVANDVRPNFLWHNKGDGTFEDVAVLSGCAVDRIGKPHAGMGVDAGDYDNDGDEDLFISNNIDEYDSLFRNAGEGIFEDFSLEANFTVKQLTGFGTRFLDYDNDGWLDLLVVNGGITADPAQVRAGDPVPYRQRDSLFRNQRDGTFADVTAKAGKAFEPTAVGRGAAFGDVDNDGDTDVLVTNVDGPLHLLINQVGQSAHWIGLRLVGGPGKRDLLGARVTVSRADGPTLFRTARTDGSYQSANDPRVLVGLGDETDVSTVRVRWPDGSVEEWPAPPIDRYTTLVSGTGETITAPPARATKPAPARSPLRAGLPKPTGEAAASPTPTPAPIGAGPRQELPKPEPTYPAPAVERGYAVFDEKKLPTCEEWGGRCEANALYCKPDVERDADKSVDLGLSCESERRTLPPHCCLPATAPYVATRTSEAYVRKLVARERAEGALPECEDLEGVCRMRPQRQPYFMREYCVPQEDGTCIEPTPRPLPPVCPEGMKELPTTKIVERDGEKVSEPANVRPCKLPVSHTRRGAFRFHGVCCIPEMTIPE